jgi:hypothetical protein
MSSDVVRYPQVGTKSELAGWIAGDLGSCKVKLYSSNTPYLPTRVVGDYTEATFVGYAQISSPAWGTPFTNGAGQAETDSPVLNWTFTGSSGTAQVFGIYITDSAETKLLVVVPFLNPVTLTPTDTVLSRTVAIQAIDSLA